MKNIYRLLLLLFALANLCCCCHETCEKKKNEAQRGILDLREWDFDTDGPIPLNGEWEFYWQRFITPGDITGNPVVINDGFIHLPGTWKNYKLDDTPLPLEGYGSFRLKVLTRHYVDKMAFRFYEQTNPLSLLINDSFITSIGKTGKTPDQEEYNSYPHIAGFSFNGNEMDIIVHVSNFHYRKCAGQKPILLGKQEQLLTQRTRELIIEFLMAGCILIISMYHVVNYICIKEKLVYNILFALLSISWIFRYLLIGNCNINALFLIISWDVRRKLIGLSIYLFFLFFSLYIKSLFPKDTINLVIYLLLISGGIVAIVYFLLPAVLFRQLAYYFIFILQILVMCLIINTVFILISVCKHKRENGIFFTINTGILFLGFIMEMISFYFKPSLYYPPFSIIIVFIFFQTYINIKHMRSYLSSTGKLIKELDERDIEIFRLKKEHKQLCMKTTELLLSSRRITSREKDVILNIIENKTNAEIADELCISYFTVRRHINNIYRKLDIDNRTALLRYLIYNN